MPRLAPFRLCLLLLLSCLVTSLQSSGAIVSLNVFQEEVAADEARAILANRSPRGLDTIHEHSTHKFWFYNYTIGTGKVKMVVDTGSSDVIVHPANVYKPSPHSVNLHARFTQTFGTTQPDGSGDTKYYGKLYRDVVGVKGLEIPDQAIGVAIRRVPKGPSGAQQANAHGTFGLAGPNSSSFQSIPHHKPWFPHVCTHNLLKECRFGLAFKQNKRGKQIFGGVDSSLFSGILRKAKIDHQWNVHMDVVADSSTFSRNVIALTDSGTTTISGPLDDVRKLFKILGITPLKSNSPKSKVYRGHFPCDKPPKLGFRLPATKEAAGPSGPPHKQPEVFYVPPSAMINRRIANNRCIAALEANKQFDFHKLWIVGQPFFQGLYIDHNVQDGTMGFANLK